MPPKIRYTREAVLNAAMEIARRQGMEGVNARAVAHTLGCSTQPLFRVFENMEQLKGALLALAQKRYNEYIRAGEEETLAYKGTGLAYIRFAREEPELFRLLFMRNRSKEKPEGQPDENLEGVLEVLMARTGFGHEEARNFHLAMWIFTHGLATMVATRYLNFDEVQLSALLGAEFEAQLAHWRVAKG